MSDRPATPDEGTHSSNFIRDIVLEDRAGQKHGGRVATRFPPEPNGYLHIGHAKSICLNFGLGAEYGGTCNLRFDDTNPARRTSSTSTRSRRRALARLRVGRRLFYASDYFEQLYEWAEQLIEKGKAYVDDQTPRRSASTAAR
jgi:glutaminyl-tRNA synthetase